MEKEIKQRMVFMVNLPKGRGSEFGGLHPCLIASVNLRNGCSPNIYVFPITHAIRKWQPTHYKLLKKKYDFFTYAENTIICEEGRSIDRNRIQGYIGEIDEIDFKEVLKCKDFIFHSKIDGIPFMNVEVGITFRFNDEIYVKIIGKKNKYDIALNLDTLECIELDDYDTVRTTWSIQEALRDNAKSIRNWLKEKENC